MIGSAPGAAAHALPALLRVGVATTVLVATFAMLNPVLAVHLQMAGLSASAIGIYAMLPFLSIALMVPLMPRLFARIGVPRAYRLGVLLEIISMLGYAYVGPSQANYAAWCAFAALGGIGTAAAWNGTEALIAHNAPPDRRGRYMGIYQTALGAALAIGPFVPGVLTLSLAAMVWLALGMLVLALSITFGRGVGALVAGHAGALPVSLVRAMARVPGLVCVAFAGGVFEAGLGSISTAHGSQTGLSLGAAASIAGALGTGSLLLQYPCGWLADHLAPRRLFSVSAAVLLLASVAYAGASVWPPVMWLSAFAWGAVGGALYTLTMIRVAHEFADSSTIAGTAAMITSYTLGGALGPAVSGVMLDGFGAVGQAGWLSLLSVCVYAVARRMSAQPPRPLAT